MLLGEDFLQSREPNLVIAARVIKWRRQRFPRKAAGVPRPQAQRARCKHVGENARLEGGVEDRLVRFWIDRAEARHAADILGAVHCSFSGLSGRPVPIIESRVTKEASRSSLQPSVPAGRIGKTR